MQQNPELFTYVKLYILYYTYIHIVLPNHPLCVVTLNILIYILDHLSRKTLIHWNISNIVFGPPVVRLFFPGTRICRALAAVPPFLWVAQMSSSFQHVTFATLERFWRCDMWQIFCWTKPFGNRVAALLDRNCNSQKVSYTSLLSAMCEIWKW